MRVHIGHHRRHTANHTWHLDLGDRKLFLKANPTVSEARAETCGHRALSGHYPIPHLHAHAQVGRWYLHLYRRYPGIEPGCGLLLDLITDAEHTGQDDRLDAAFGAILGHYRRVIAATAGLRPPAAVVQKLFGDRAAPGGRLDLYYRRGSLWVAGPGPLRLAVDDVPATILRLTGAEYRLDLPALLIGLREVFAERAPVWSALTQGDPTAANLGWTPAGGPVWFDFDTGGHNALAGEFAVALTDLLLHGARLTPAMNPAAYRDHPAALAAAPLRAGATLHHLSSGNLVDADLHHRPSPVRRRLAAAYLTRLVYPVAADLGIGDVVGWLRPYLLMRLLGVYRPADLAPADAIVLLAAIIHARSPHLDLETLFDLTAPLEARR